MTIPQLQYLLEVYRTGSISQAARNLSVAQSSISSSLSTLEAELGFSVFSRSRQGVHPTTQGLVILEQASRICESYRIMTENTQPHCRQVRIGSAAYPPISDAFTRLAVEYHGQKDTILSHLTCSVSAAVEKSRTIMMYKPVGVLSSASDPFGGETVVNIIKGQIQERLVPVGRLDKDSEGLILLSNDGDLALKLTHPRYEHEKTYIVRAAGRWSEDKLDVLRGPVEMPDGYVTRPVPVEVLRKQENNVHLLLFKLKEGRKRQIRYMCSAAHLVVLSLKRVQIAKLRLDDTLKPGEWRDLTDAELACLK